MGQTTRSILLEYYFFLFFNSSKTTNIKIWLLKHLASAQILVNFFFLFIPTTTPTKSTSQTKLSQFRTEKKTKTIIVIIINITIFKQFLIILTNPNTFKTNPFTPLQLQQNHYNDNNNPFLSNQTSFRNPNPNYLFPTDIYATRTFFDPPSPQTLGPLHQQHHYHNNYNSLDFLLNDVSDPILDFSSPEDQILLAPFLSEPQCPNTLDEFLVPLQDHVKEEIVNHQYFHDQKKKKPSGGATATVVSPQSIAARERRRKIMERTSELGKLIPGGNKMSTAEMFQAASKYVKFLQAQVSVLQHLGSSNQNMKEEQLYAKELQVLSSPIIQEKLYSEEKCLVTKEFLDRTQVKNQLPQANLV